MTDFQWKTPKKQKKRQKTSKTAKKGVKSPGKSGNFGLFFNTFFSRLRRGFLSLGYAGTLEKWRSFLQGIRAPFGISVTSFPT
jgi:hypothetical protein